MFLLRTAMRNIWRCKSKSILTIFLCIIIISLLNVYWGNIESNRRQLNDLADTIPIYCRISNLTGSKVAGLDIPEETVQNLQSSSHVKELVFTVRLMAGEGAFSIEDWKENLDISTVGTNSIKGVEGIHEDQIKLKEGASLDFLRSSANVCIVSRSCMKEKRWEIGDIVTLNLFYYFHKNEYSLKIEPLGLAPFEIIGSMENAAYDDSGYLPAEILLPMEAVRKIYRSNEIPFSADSAFFYLQDPLHLNEFKKEMKDIRLLPQSFSAKDSDKGQALVVKDSVFITAANRLRQGMSTLLGFLPMVLIIVILIGYITSYLLVYSRKKDFAIMRSIGFHHKKVFTVFLLEQQLLVFGASGLQCVLALVFITHRVSILLVVNLGFFICFMMGVVIAIWRFGRRSIMEVLSQND